MNSFNDILQIVIWSELEKQRINYPTLDDTAFKTITNLSLYPRSDVFGGYLKLMYEDGDEFHNSITVARTPEGIEVAKNLRQAAWEIRDRLLNVIAQKLVEALK